MASLPPPCVEHSKRLGDIELKQAVVTHELQSLKDANYVEHKAIRDDLQEVKADIKNMTRILIGEQGDNGIASRLRRVEEGHALTAEASKATKGAVATTVAAFLALLGVVAQAIITWVTSGGGGAPTP